MPLPFAKRDARGFCIDFNWTQEESSSYNECKFNHQGDSMRNIMLLLALSTLMISCKEISGSLEVTQNFQAKVDNKCGWDPFGNCAPTKEVMVAAGNYKAVVDFSSKEQIKMQIKANKVTETILLKRPANFEFPTNGDFQLSASEIDQDFDVHGDVQTQVVESPTRKEVESCTYTRSEYVCYPSGPNGQPTCSYQPRQVWGYRHVEYFLKTTVRDLSAQILNQQAMMAHFVGHREDSEKIYLYQGFCR